jgi:type IV secretory pathway TraG/TraD family ATPase VirD4
LVKTHSKDLPTPLSLKTNDFDIAFAKNLYAGGETTIGLTENERQKHVYIIGATGTGKTTMIQSMVKEDIEKGKGLCVIDPHGDLAESIIALIPKSRKDDFIYFNPDDIKHPVGLNLLELSPNEDEDEILREKELITESVISLFRKIFSDVWSAHAHRLEYILRNTIQTALCLKDPNIFTVYYLLTDPLFKEEALRHVDDENLNNFWKNEFEKAGDYQKVKMIGPITSRIGRFLFSPTAKRIMEQTKSTINFEEIMDSGKILICNLSKGKIGEDNSEVLGIMILTKIQLASLKRARSKQEERKSFYLYVDEFQNFATPSFIQMLSESRKYKVFLTMAEQSTSQQKDRNIVNVILANVGTVISFRSANPDDERLMLPQFAPYIQEGEIANLPLYKFYIKISAVNPEQPFSGMTVPVKIPKDSKKLEELIQLSRDHYTTLYVKPKPVKTVIKANGKKAVNKEEIKGYVKEPQYVLTE